MGQRSAASGHQRASFQRGRYHRQGREPKAVDLWRPCWRPASDPSDGYRLGEPRCGKEVSQPEDRRLWHGRVLGVPYDFRPPTLQRFRKACSNENAGRITPTPWGLGWVINCHKLIKLVGKKASFAPTLHAPRSCQQRRAGAYPSGHAAPEPALVVPVQRKRGMPYLASPTAVGEEL